MTTLLWLRNDLRLADNPALVAALEVVGPLLPLYIHDPAAAGPWAPGGASRWWLHHSLAALGADLAARGSRLHLAQGDSLAVLQGLVAELGVTRVVWNRRYEPWAIAQDRAIKATLEQAGVEVQSHNAALLYEPWQLLKGDGTPYKVFTPYWKAMQQRGLAHQPWPIPECLPAAPATEGVALEQLALLPMIAWDTGFAPLWAPGEAGAVRRLELFLRDALREYDARRDFPAESFTSGLAAHLHFGEIGPRQILAAVRGVPGAEPWLRQLAWREFAVSLLYYFPQTVDEPLDGRFAAYPWAQDAEALLRWQRGQTGIPLVDAGMRELWTTGTMHNRVRMVVASFLTKNLRQPWQAGAAWFWDTLLDADQANNTMGWQWVAGCGADAAPYFRVFNPVLQGEKFDPQGAYVRRWVPELGRLSGKAIHQPWRSGVVRGYPPPMVDLAQSRALALEGYARIKG